MAGLYAAINEGAYEQGSWQAPLERANFFLSRSALFAMLWGPLLGFVWLVKAQELNRRIGLKMTDGGCGRGEGVMASQTSSLNMHGARLAETGGGVGRS